MADITVRPVTDDEIEFFFDNGWVRLPGLLDPALAAMLLGRAKSIFGDDGRAGLKPLAPEARAYESWFRTNTDAEEDEAFQALAMSRELGRNAARLLGRDSAIRVMVAKFMAKLPQADGLGEPTDFHQDTPGHMYLEANFLTAWIALDEVTPEMGALQFYTGSHKLGNLGQLGELWDAWKPRIDRSCSLTDPIALQPGDATVHMNGMIHGTAPNVSDRPRWSWASVMVPADARYTGAASPFLDGLGLEPGGSIDHPKYPVIYAP